jgi:hypothetical protein
LYNKDSINPISRRMLMKKHLGYALSVVTALLFAAACNSGVSGVALDDSNTGNYGITLSVEEGGKAFTSRRRANKGQSVTLTVIPPEGGIPEAEGEEADGGGGG